MWKKDELPTPAPEPEPVRRGETRAPETRTPVAPGERATIGRSITIKGEVTGDEDLLIQGRVEGSVDLKQHSVTVGPEGEVKASILGRVVTVEGSVEGDVSADEQVILRSSAFVQGDIVAPRVVLEDGARFRGGVDMGEVADRSIRGGSAAAAPTKRPAETSAKPKTDAVDTSTDKGKGSSDKQLEIAN